MLLKMVETSFSFELVRIVFFFFFLYYLFLTVEFMLYMLCPGDGRGDAMNILMAIQGF